MSVLELAWHKYLTQLERNPIKTKAITAGVVAALADILAQRISSNHATRLNWRRTIALALYGCIWGGPSNHYWQIILEWIVPKRSNDSLRPAKKVLIDQLTYGPFNNILFMFFISRVVEGRSWKSTKAKIVQDYPNVQSRGWRLWPLAQFINQSFVPLNLRVLFTNAVAFSWSTFLILRSKTTPTRHLPVLKRHTA